MHLTLRLRATIACLVSVGLAVACAPWVLYLWHHAHTVHRTERFYRILGRPAKASSVHLGLYRTGLALAVAVLALVLVSYLLVIWALQPVRALTTTLNSFGPTNLGQRNHRAGRNDELRRLADAVDQMLDRFTAGYEGQRMFAANASHELRTPLAVQRALIEVSLDHSPTPEQLALLTRQLLGANERNEALIEGLLVLTESDRGLASTDLVPFDVLVAEIVEIHRDMAKRADVEIVVDLTDRVVRGERVLLERLVTNLVQNAIKYNEPGGVVEVAVGHRPALRVRNSGEIVRAESVAQLFEPFRRLSTARTINAGGAGLGLTIARSIVQAHEGTIRATPQPGGGLQIDVELAAD